MYPDEFRQALIERLKKDDSFYYVIMEMLSEKYECDECDFIEYADNRFPDSTIEDADKLFLDWIKGNLKNVQLYKDFLLQKEKKND